MKCFKILLFTLVIIVSYFSGCKKNVEAGIVTTVKGFISDPNKQQPIANATIFIREYKYEFPRMRMQGIVDSTKTGVDGRYSIRFTTTGKGAQYRVIFKPEANFSSNYYPVPIETGGEITLDFFAYEMHILKARIQVVDNPNPPVRVTTFWSWGEDIYGRNNDTVVFLKVFPNYNNPVTFSIINVDTPQIYNLRRDTLFLPGFADTFTHTFQVEPRTFRLRG